MEAKITLPDQIKDPKPIKELVKKVIEQVNVNQIYLTLGEKKHPFKYRLTIILEDMAKRFKEQASGIVKNIFKEHPEYDVRFFTLSYIIQETNQGNTFFLNTCTNENLIYAHNQSDSGWIFNKIDISTVIEKGKHNFLLEKEKINAFKKGAALFLQEQNHNQAAFMLHQAIEQSFLTAERFLIGTTFVGHAISDHQAFIGNINKELGNIFPRNTEKQIKLLYKLNQAYSKTRYTLDYEIKHRQVEKINKKAQSLIELLETLVNEELSRCGNTIESYLSKAQETTIHTKPKEETNMTNDTQSTLEHIKKLSEDNFVLLKPINGVRKGYYLNYCHVHDYFELFSILRSTLNVCILALDGQTDLTLDIKDIDSDVKSVLEFSKNLIPLEEGNYLDEMRELMLTKEAKQ